MRAGEAAMTEPTLLEQIWAHRTLLWLFTAFVIAVLFVFRPGSGKIHRDIANIPFRHDDKPASDDPDGHHKEARS
jgi:cytochrome c oxidase cbb3-type subunit IV